MKKTQRTDITVTRPSDPRYFGTGEKACDTGPRSEAKYCIVHGSN